MTDTLTHWKLITATTAPDLTESVRKLMDEGWRPIGNHQVTIINACDGSIAPIISQAMAKYKKRDSK